MKQIVYAFARNTVFANILLVLLFLAGGFACFSMIKETFPPMEMDMISISVAYPGADPEEVEEGVSRKIEDALESLEGIKEYTTMSAENVSTATIEVLDGYRASEVLEDVRATVNAISTFPADAENPVIKEVLMKDSVITLYLSSDMPERRLKAWGKRIEDRLKQLPSVSQTAVTGTREYEISIEVSEKILTEYGLTFDQVAAAVRNSSINLAGGTLKTRGEEIRIRTVGRKYTGEELGNIILIASPSGQSVTLGRIARIVDGFDENPARAHVNGKQALLITVYKTEKEDAITISDAVHAFVEKNRDTFPDGVTLDVLYDRTTMLRARINLLVKNGRYGLIVVFLLLWTFLNTRLSFWVGMGIPVSITGALAILWAIGGSINMISLFGLILVLGIVVDDAIVVGEAIFVHRKTESSPLKAAVEGVMEVGLPVLAAVLTTIIAFIPLAFVGGTMGKFISILPPVVIACLLVSLVECLILLPAHLNHLPAPDLSRESRGPIARLDRLNRLSGKAMEWFVERVYQPFLSQVLRWRYITLCVSVSILLAVVGIVRGGLIKFQVFPEIDGFVVTASVVFPNGTPVSVTETAVARLEASLISMGGRLTTQSGDPLVKESIAIIGSAKNVTGPNAGMVQAILLESEKRGIHSKDIVSQWEEEAGPIPGAESLTFEALAPGHGGTPLEVWIQGDVMDTILAAADGLMEKLREYDGVTQVKSDFSQGKKELRLELKPEARALGLTVADLAGQANAAFYGNEVLRLQRGDDDIRVKIRYTEKERGSLATLGAMRIRTPDGGEVPLHSVADLSFQPGFATITRTNGQRRVSVTAGVNTKKANTNEIYDELSATYFREMSATHPELKFVLQGDKKRSRESFSSLKIGFPLALVGIFAVVATMFRSYLQPVIIMCTIPFGIIGAVLGHLAMGYDLSIMSVFGMVALTGVVVNDAIVLIERINVNISQGLPFFQAILQGGTRRFRAIFLTTLSTVGGLLPMLLETDLQARFLIPMAISLAAGVSFATLLTLILIPSLLVILNDARLVLHRVRRGEWKERAAVEPAIHRFQGTDDAINH